MQTQKSTPACKAGASKHKSDVPENKSLNQKDPLSKPPAYKFMQDRKYMKNVTAKTLTWYQEAFNHFPKCETEQDYKDCIVGMMERGLSPVSINTWIRVINAFLHWEVAPSRKCSPHCTHIHLPTLKVEQKTIETFSPAQVHKLVNAQPKTFGMRRIQALATIILDTGLRIHEVVKLRKEDCDLESLVLTVVGKGRKHRKVPISLEGRKALHKWLRGREGEYVFGTETGTPLAINNAQKDLRQFCKGLGISDVRTSPHTLRHTFAVAYLRAGGNLEYLRRILGHASILITQGYLKSLSHDDVTKVHSTFSPLSAA